MPHVHTEVAIPPELSPDNVMTYIIDTSSLPANKEALEDDIREADVIVLIYAVDNPRSFERLHSHWLPYLRRIMPHVTNAISLKGILLLSSHHVDSCYFGWQ